MGKIAWLSTRFHAGRVERGEYIETGPSNLMLVVVGDRTFEIDVSRHVALARAAHNEGLNDEGAAIRLADALLESGALSHACNALLEEDATPATDRDREVSTAIAAWLFDRAEQYDQSDGIHAALCEVAAKCACGEPLESWRHGELDDLLERARRVAGKGGKR